MVTMRHVVIVAGSRSYRTADFVEAARVLRAVVTVASDVPPPIAETAAAVEVDLDDPEAAATRIADVAPDADAVVAVDDQGVLTAGRACTLLGLGHNPLEALQASRDKLAMRRLLGRAGITQPAYLEAPAGTVAERATRLGYPVVVKPRGLAASRGVIRLDGPARAGHVEDRIRNILATAGRDRGETLLVEEYIEGPEVVVEGLLVGGELEVLAVIDKPEPLTGPWFEETLLVTPSRHAADTQRAVTEAARSAAAAMGLVVGPIHAEIRLAADGTPTVLEVAARTIGGLCGRALTFGLVGESLEVLVLRSALGMPVVDTTAALPASGVLMLPIPASGRFTGAEGTDRALGIEGITGVEITVPVGSQIRRLPEGDRYLGFVFAAGASPDDVEQALRLAAAELTVTIDGEAVRPVIGGPLPGIPE